MSLDERFRQEEHVDVWPDHVDALSLFQSCATQWRTVAVARTFVYLGLDYTAIYGHPRYARLDPDKQIEVLEALQCIEYGALSVLNKP